MNSKPNTIVHRNKHLEAFPVNDGWSCLVVLLVGDPHSLEGRQRSQDGATNPDRVLSLWWGDDLDLHGGRSEGGDLLLHTVSNTWVHGGTAGEDVVGVEVLSDINIALHDRVVGSLVNTGGFHTNERWLEEGLWASESFVTDGDDLTVGKLIRLLERGRAGSGGHLLPRVEHDTGGSARGVEGEYGLDGDVHGWEVEGLKHDLSHLFSVSLGVEWGLGEEGWALLGGDSELVAVGVVPDLFHIVPIGDDTVLDGVFEGEDTSLGLGFVTYVRVFLAHTDHDSLVAGSANDGWEYGSGSIVTGETALAESGSVVDDQVGGPH